MKKLLTFISSLLVLSCSNSMDSEILQPIEQTQVKTNSVQSIYTLYKKYKENCPKIFNAMDLNKDSFVTKEEYTNYNLALFKFSIPLINPGTFESLDRNKDTKITIKEADLNLLDEIKFIQQIRDFATDTFVDFDQNKDEYLDKDELLNKKLFWLSKITVDQNNKIDFSKIKFSEELFNNFDENQDNKLNKSELEILAANEGLEFLLVLDFYKFRVGKSTASIK